MVSKCTPRQQHQNTPRSIIMAAAHLSTYSDCVSSLRTSLKFLESSVETLDNGVSDFPRLVNVLKTVRVRLTYLMSRSFRSYSSALRTHPPTHTHSSRNIPPRRNRSLYRSATRPCRLPNRAPGTPHRDSQSPRGATAGSSTAPRWELRWIR